MRLTLKNRLKHLDNRITTLKITSKNHAEKIKDLEEKVSLIERNMWKNGSERIHEKT